MLHITDWESKVMLAMRNQHSMTPQVHDKIKDFWLTGSSGFVTKP
ncbi:hypothetical protein AM1_5281 [Acaryochloris marina MBIC11017]|uniref:Uncharacterized protein n=1 Tax=Acaryochloris marina (strain MBIC 11017) TaxID=329726 RepID=B0CAP1_ACAM1|nr:hypothetical protein AM1_5281 [Acaryochloris marina MBIC11017]